MDGWVGGIRNMAQLRPAKAGAGAWPELGNSFHFHCAVVIFSYTFSLVGCLEQHANDF